MRLKMEIERYRTETRKERYTKKAKTAVTLPIEIVTVNFINEENIGYLIRACACFGVTHIHVIGTLPSHDALRRCSGSTQDLVHISLYKTPGEFLKCIRDTHSYLVSLELTEAARPLITGNYLQAYTNRKAPYNFETNRYDNWLDSKLIIAIGNENVGVSPEILVKSDEICCINMPGAGYSLNAAQTCNIALYEITRQMGYQY